MLRSEFLDVLASVQTPATRAVAGIRWMVAGDRDLATAAGMGCYAGFATWAATAPIEVLAQLGTVSATD